MVRCADRFVRCVRDGPTCRGEERVGGSEHEGWAPPNKCRPTVKLRRHRRARIANDIQTTQLTNTEEHEAFI